MEKCKKMLSKLSDFYLTDGRKLPWRCDCDPYHVWISEIMLQQTRVEAVIPYYERFLSLFPTVFDLASAPEDVLLKAWEGLGYYSRARNLGKAAKVVAEKYGGVFPKDFNALLSLPGIGEYTAAAIASICFDLPYAAIDGNVLRIYARVFADGRDVTDAKVKKDIKEALESSFPKNGAAAITQGFMDIGQRFCSPNGTPRCEECPLLSLCTVGQSGDYASFPYRKPKKPRRIIQKTVLLLHVADSEGGKFLIRKRPKEGLLGGLWEFPSVDESLSVEEAVKQASALGVSPLAALPAIAAVHIFTHLEWHMQGVLIECEGGASTLTAASAEELKEKYPIASAFRAFKDFIFEAAK